MSPLLDIVELERIDSSQLELQRRLSVEPLQRPLLVIAHEQTAGRGRLGRSWFGHPGHTLMFSLWSPTPTLPAERLPLLSLAAGLALVEWLDACLATCQLKWPNDVLGPDCRKLAGILCEGVWNGASPRGAIIGVGVNVSWPSGDMPAEIKNTAAALQDYGSQVGYNELKSDLPTWAGNYLRWQDKIVKNELDDLAIAYNKKLLAKARPVTYKSFESPSVVGYIEGVSKAGKLQFRRQSDGELLEITSGELALADLPNSELRES